jgi:hypothetical protein
MKGQLILAWSGEQVKYARVFYIKSVVNATYAALCKLFLTDTARHSIPNTSVRPHPRHVHYSTSCITVRLAQRVKLGM